MLDLMDPAFLGMLKLGIPAEKYAALRLVISTWHHPENDRYMRLGEQPVIPFINQFASMGVVARDTVGDTCFETVYAGAGGLGLHTYDRDYYGLPGRQLDGLRVWRNYIYARHAVPLPPPTRTRNAATPHVLILNQKDRTLRGGGSELKALVQKALPAAKVTLTSWGAPGLRSFKSKLELLRTVDIQISGPGSTKMNEVFLGNGAVSIGYGVVGGFWTPALPAPKAGNGGGKLAVFFDDYVDPVPFPPAGCGLGAREQAGSARPRRSSAPRRSRAPSTR